MVRLAVGDNGGRRSPKASLARGRNAAAISSPEIAGAGAAADLHPCDSPEGSLPTGRRRRRLDRRSIPWISTVEDVEAYRQTPWSG